MKDPYPIRGRTFEALGLSRQQVNHLRSEKFAAKHQNPKERAPEHFDGSLSAVFAV